MFTLVQTGLQTNKASSVFFCYYFYGFCCFFFDLFLWIRLVFMRLNYLAFVWQGRFFRQTFNSTICVAWCEKRYVFSLSVAVCLYSSYFLFRSWRYCGQTLKIRRSGSDNYYLQIDMLLLFEDGFFVSVWTTSDIIGSIFRRLDCLALSISRSHLSSSQLISKIIKN